MKILITGGAGFIGSHLSQRLLEQGHSVTVIDNLSTGSLDNIASLRQNPAFTFVYDNIRNTSMMGMLIKECDCVYHLAAAVGVQLIANQPVQTIETNIHGTEVVLETANKFSKKVFIASTSEVYGKSEKSPFREDDDTVLGSTIYSRWAYAASKAVDEFLALAYHQEYGLPIIIARLFNTVGPRQTGKYGMVIPRFVESALKNEPLTIYGTGTQSRCFCFVGDVIDAITGLMNSPAAPGRVYNIGSTEEITMNDLADRIVRLTGSKSTKRLISYSEAYGKPFDDMLRRVPSLERIQSVINFQPKTTLDQTLNYIIEFERQKMLK
ncbi:MAG: nucleoside-diphosphate sugar epimerase [Planctomycetes bacterium GWF2_50_10]|nr:MAG: nucleoside-diphosphate sugar epimerase [Planctomycetes bacterium GWF2_50_10]